MQTQDLCLVPKEAATQGNTCFYFREEKDDNKVILEDKDLEVIGTPSVQYDDCTVIAQARNIHTVVFIHSLAIFCYGCSLKKARPCLGSR